MLISDLRTELANLRRDNSPRMLESIEMGPAAWIVFVESVTLDVAFVAAHYVKISGVTIARNIYLPPDTVLKHYVGEHPKHFEVPCPRCLGSGKIEPDFSKDWQWSHRR